MRTEYLAQDSNTVSQPSYQLLFRHHIYPLGFAVRSNQKMDPRIRVAHNLYLEKESKAFTESRSEQKANQFYLDRCKGAQDHLDQLESFRLGLEEAGGAVQDGVLVSKIIRGSNATCAD